MSTRKTATIGLIHVAGMVGVGFAAYTYFEPGGSDNVTELNTAGIVSTDFAVYRDGSIDNFATDGREALISDARAAGGNDLAANDSSDDGGVFAISNGGGNLQ